MTDSIYGGITEHPEFPLTDSRRFTVTILSHVYEPGPRGCARCGFAKFENVHHLIPMGNAILARADEIMAEGGKSYAQAIRLAAAEVRA